jgi:peptidoglycan/xylan/chitin deacetylase (PgdA/CDA1 family)
VNLTAGLFKFFRFLFSGFCQPAVLVWHRISPNVSTENGLSAQIFEAQLKVIKNLRLKVPGLNQIISNESSRDSVYLTFDDGTSDFLDRAWPIIRKFNFPVTLFIVAENIGKPGYLTLTQLKELLLSGLVTIGSHTLTHSFLPDLSHEDIDYELSKSKAMIEELLGIKVELLAYPWGGFNSYVKDAARRLGYLAAFTTNQELKGTKKDRGIFCLKRLTVTEDEPFFKFLIKLSGFATLFCRKLKENQLV